MAHLCSALSLKKVATWVQQICKKKKKKKPWSHSLISLALFMFAAYAWILLLLWYSGFAAESEGSL